MGHANLQSHVLEVDEDSVWPLSTWKPSSDHSGGDQSSHRVYHGQHEGAYQLPNDEREQYRLNNQHEMFKLVFNGYLSWVPISEDIKKILDIGCGTGIWAIEMAKTHPQASITGVDISSIQPESKPTNCTFVHDNVEQDWQFGHKFDFIYERYLAFGIHDWNSLFRRCFENLEAGGWFESTEFRIPVRSQDGRNGAFADFMALWVDAMQKAGMNAHASDGFADLLRAQGFVNVERVDLRLPCGPWAKGEKHQAIGQRMMQNVEDVHQAGATAIQRLLGYSQEEANMLMKASQEDAVRGHYYLPVVCHRAQKPPNREQPS